MAKKAFFNDRTLAEIKGLGSEYHASNELVSRILDLNPSDHFVIDVLIIPENFPTPNKYKKHATEVKLKRFSSQEELIKTRLLPVQQRERVFDRLHETYIRTGKGGFFSGYTFKPVGVDETPRKAALVSCLDASRILQYIHSVPGMEIKFKGYDNSKIVDREGGSFVFDVPSRTEKRSRWNVGLENVAVIDNDMKYVIAQIINSDHICPEKRYNRELRFKFKPEEGKELREHSAVVQFCPHDIAAYWQLADNYWNKKKNIVPLMANPFAMPTQYAVDFYKKLLNNVLIRDKGKLRKPNQADQEALVWGLVMHDGHDKTFFAREKLRDYDWTKPGEK